MFQCHKRDRFWSLLSSQGYASQVWLVLRNETDLFYLAFLTLLYSFNGFELYLWCTANENELRHSVRILISCLSSWTHLSNTSIVFLSNTVNFVLIFSSWLYSSILELWHEHFNVLSFLKGYIIHSRHLEKIGNS